MKFTLEEVDAAHTKVKSGADFPQYVKDLKDLGMTGYTVDARTGKTTYSDTEGALLATAMAYVPLLLNEVLNREQFAQRLKLHQQGGTDYPTFCKDCTDNGVAGWLLDFDKMTCTYFDVQGNDVLTEQIAAVK
ncbi:MAG: DUF1398 domain-containing protein [Sphingobacteriales bacterium]|nr:MAG: DUF1398 domain-containing protein [Sphingobacteriales bacterium]